MAKKIQKKAAKKPAKKTAKKAVKKAGAKKAGAKKAGKSAAKKTSAKKAVKKAVKKAAKKVTRAAKKVAKKAVKKTGGKRPAGALKKAAKKVVKKMVAPAKKAVKKAVKKVSGKGRISNAMGVLSNTVSSMVKDAMVSVMDKTSRSSDSGNASSEKGSGEEEEEEETGGPRFKVHQTKLKAGEMAPYFEGNDQNGRKVSLYSLSGKTIILYFYPKDDTEGCTATSCNLRDEYKYLTDYNYAVVGVSADDERSHMKFSEKYALPFPLLADTDKTIIKAYDVWGRKQLAGKIYDGIVRTTFLIDCYGVISNVITNVDTKDHTRQILAL